MTAIARITNAFPGQIATNSLVVNKRSAINEEASAELRFGVMVEQGTAADGAQLMDGATDVLKGIVVQNHDFAKDQELGDTGLKPKAVFDVLEEGDIYVVCEVDVVVGDQVHVRHTASGGNTVVGAFTKTAEAAKTMDISKFARWVAPGGATSPPILRINLTMQAALTADT